MNKLAKQMVVLVVLFGLVTNTAAMQEHGPLIDPGKSEPNQPGAVQYRIGVFYQLRGEHQRAIAEFTQTTEAMPGNGYAWAARGDSYAALGDYKQAIEDYNEAIRIYPDYVSALYTRARAYASLDQAELALADYANAIRQMPDYPNLYWGLGDLYFDAGQAAQALENYQMYLTLVGLSPDQRVLERFQMLSMVAAEFS
jgi:tetratricopeptide (TPR) repeat protein